MKAITREEKIISGENLTPITRKEMFLAKASGQNIQTPTPITREEYFLSKITGGGGSVEGTAIPVGVPVENIYFNTNLSGDKTIAYLSQLTYVDIGFEAPINVIFGSSNNFLIAMKLGEGSYTLAHTTQPNLDGDVFVCFSTGGFSTGALGWYQLPRTVVVEGDNNEFEDVPVSYCCVGGISLGEPSYADLDGIPIGAENEKIKNVLSITPFGASGGNTGDSDSDFIVCDYHTPSASNSLMHLKGLKISYPNESANQLADNAFLLCGYLTAIDLPHVIKIGAFALGSCSSLTYINLPKVTSIGEGAFALCTALTSIDLPNVTSIGERAFEACASLTSIDLPNVTSIEERTFGMHEGTSTSCAALKLVDLGKATSIGNRAFYGCTSLETLILRTTETVCVIDLTAFDATTFFADRSIGGQGGHIYVPATMYEYYRAGYEEALTSVLGTGAFDRIVRKIEDYPEICG